MRIPAAQLGPASGENGSSNGAEAVFSVREPTVLSQVLRNAGVLLGGDAASKVVRFAAALILARALGPSGYGIFNVGIAAAGVLAIVSSLGLPDVASREVAVNPAAGRSTSGRVVAARVSASMVGGSVLLVAVAAIDPNAIPLAVAALALAVIAGTSLDWLLRAHAHVRPVALATTAAGVVALLAASAVALADRSPAVAVGGFACAEAVGALICWKATPRNERPMPTLNGLVGLLRLSWPVAVSGVAFYVYYANFDTLVLAGFRSAGQAGVYSAGYRVFVGLNVVGAYVSYASLPFLARMLASATERKRADRLVADTASRLAVYGLLVVGAAMLIGGPALGALFGSRYRSAGGAFVLLCVALAWYSATYPVGYALIAERRNRGYMLGAVMGGAFNVVLCLALIPWAGMIGAATATLVSFAAAGVVWLKLRRPSNAGFLVLTLTCVTAIASFAVAVPDASLVLGAAVIVVALALAIRVRQLASIANAEAEPSAPADVRR